MKRGTPIRMRSLGVLLLLVIGVLFPVRASMTLAEDLHDVLRRKDVASGLAWIDASENRLVESLVSLASIVSPRGCCNMSIPVSQGRLAIGLHGGRGGQRAAAEEWASIPAMMRTAKYVALLAAAY